VATRRHSSTNCRPTRCVSIRNPISGALYSASRGTLRQRSGFFVVRLVRSPPNMPYNSGPVPSKRSHDCVKEYDPSGREQ
jgi:hypothetical protein